jgi:NAD(P)-dependent dehydrogenase (short-subunit alcohol dehydrogenase family)
VTGTSALEGKTALVTGASAGLGRRFAVALGAAGARVGIASRRTDRLETLAEEIRSAGGQAAAFALDVTDAASVSACLDATEAALGPVDVLVNNAGIGIPKRILDITEEDYDALMATNAKGAWLMAQEAGRRMIERGQGGRIINTASMGGLIATRQLSVYGMSKAAVIHMTKAMALEWARFGINVNAICPGYVSTEMNSSFFESEDGRKFVSTFPRKRLIEEEDFDGMIVLLASDQSRIITGSIITMDDAQGFTLY